MIFDYKLREGSCPATNALKLMEIEGLPVGWEFTKDLRAIDLI